VNDARQFLPHVYLRPGELVIAEEPTLVTTVLGSCISVILFSPRLRVGAICHATMPSGEEETPGKYADQSVLYMLNEFRDRGIKRQETVVKVFGGADMFGRKSEDSKERGVGGKNASVAIRTLTQEGYEPAVVDVGGDLGRKLVFRTHTGEVFRKWVKKELLTY